jgi:hypothetical protein
MAMNLSDLAYWLDAVNERGEQVRKQAERARGGESMMMRAARGG